MFITDQMPRATAEKGQLQSVEDWTLIPTLVARDARIGSGAVIIVGVTIGAGALEGAGAVATTDVAAGTGVAGAPARLLAQRAHEATHQFEPGT